MRPRSWSDVRDDSAVTLVLDVPDWPGHLPGQHVDVRLTAPDGYTATRSYSVSAPEEDDHVELTVQRVPDGEVSSFLADGLAVGGRGAATRSGRRVVRLARGRPEPCCSSPVARAWCRSCRCSGPRWAGAVGRAALPTRLLGARARRRHLPRRARGTCHHRRRGGAPRPHAPCPGRGPAPDRAAAGGRSRRPGWTAEDAPTCYVADRRASSRARRPARRARSRARPHQDRAIRASGP